jgi:uncharacterized protein HemX
MPATVLSAVVATAVFGSLQATESYWLRVIAIVLSLLASIFSAIQVRSSKNAEYSANHRIAAAGYGNAKRKIDRIRSSPQMDNTELQKRLDSLEQRLDQLDEESPRIPNYVRKKIEMPPVPQTH